MDNQLYQYSNNILYSMVAGSGFVVAVILMSGKTDKTSVTALLVVYSILFVSVCIKAVLAGNKLDLSSYGTTMSKILNFMMMFFPFLSILAVILWILVIVSVYYDRITEGKVSDYYTSFMNIAGVMLLIQIYMIFSETSNKTSQLSLKTYSILRMLSVLASLSVLTVWIVLKFYVTDC
jgi:hypothetical protein